jgi:hypothetical protein
MITTFIIIIGAISDLHWALLQPTKWLLLDNPDLRLDNTQLCNRVGPCDFALSMIQRLNMAECLEWRV